MFSKIVVKGEGINPLYQYLTSSETKSQFRPDGIKWNFEKFLIGRDGKVVGSLRTEDRVPKPSKGWSRQIEAELAEK